jgi:hypothetical protein
VKPIEKIREEKRLLKQKLISELSVKVNDLCSAFTRETGCIVNSVDFDFIEILSTDGESDYIIDRVNIDIDRI